MGDVPIHIMLTLPSKILWDTRVHACTNYTLEIPYIHMEGDIRNHHTQWIMQHIHMECVTSWSNLRLHVPSDTFTVWGLQVSHSRPFPGFSLHSKQLDGQWPQSRPLSTKALMHSVQVIEPLPLSSQVLQL